MAEPPAFSSAAFQSSFQTSGTTTSGGGDGGTAPTRARGLRQRTLRQMCIEADPSFIEASIVDIEYEFGGGRRIFKGRYQHRGPYGDI